MMAGDPEAVNTRNQRSEVRVQKEMTRWFGWLMFMSLCCAALAADPADLHADRAAIERVYYQHRLGEKPSFEQLLPPGALENLVQQDLRKEAALKKAYGIEVIPAQIDAEVHRITTTTRAPEILTEIKAALGNDPARFARTMAKPILVERLLREKFENDDTLHAPQRRQAEQMRNELLAAKKNGASLDQLKALLKCNDSNLVIETIWQLGAREVGTNAPNVDLLEIKKRFGPGAQILSSPQSYGKEVKSYLQDLPEELQNVLRVQLRQPGDVSAVIEMPGGFLLYVAKLKTDTVLSVASLSLPKCGYEQWLEEQTKE